MVLASQKVYPLSVETVCCGSGLFWEEREGEEGITREG
jgi:hypothetical protein